MRTVRHHPHSWPNQPQAGFTLVEVLVAISIMALLGSMSWLGMDALFRARSHSVQRAIDNQEMQITLGQWTTDLEQALLLPDTDPMGWDGQTFRLTRRAHDPQQGVIVIAWAVRSTGDTHGQSWLMRWQSAPITTVAQWDSAWEAAAQWSRGASLGQPAMLMPALGMDIHLWTHGTWVNAQSSRTATESPPPPETSPANTLTPTGPRRGRFGRLLQAGQPDGVRLMVRTPKGAWVKDWANPTFSTQRS